MTSLINHTFDVCKKERMYLDSQVLNLIMQHLLYQANPAIYHQINSFG